MKVGRQAFFHGTFKAAGGVDLDDATIGANLDLSDGKFVGSGSRFAFSAGRAAITGSVHFGGRFYAEGGVNLNNMTIDGDLVCDQGHFIGNAETLALSAASVNVRRHLCMRNGFKADGGVNLAGAKVDGNLDCSGGQFSVKSPKFALEAGGAEVKGNVFLNNRFRADGGVDLVGVKIDGNLDCDNGQFCAERSALALNANGSEIKGHVFMRETFEADGGVDLTAAKIDGTLECDQGQFVGNDKTLALYVNSTEVRGNVYLRNRFKAVGGVDLISAKIGGTLACNNGQFFGNERVAALAADSVKIEGNVFLIDRFRAEGIVSFVNADIGRGFQCSDVESRETLILDLRLAKIGILLNADDSWPTEGNLQLDGLVYGQIADGAHPNARKQLRWINLQRHVKKDSTLTGSPAQIDDFRSQPFEELADVLRKMGLEEDARAVMIAKNEEHARYAQVPEWLWYGLFGQLIGYGYSPWRAFGISLIVIGIGWRLFRWGYRRGLVTPTGDTKYTVETDGAHPCSDDFPKFNALIYSLESFVPLVKLGLGDHWLPNANRGEVFPIVSGMRLSSTTGSLLRGYLWFHIIAGWVLTTLWVGGITGLVKT
jgi:hypothetical protein